MNNNTITVTTYVAFGVNTTGLYPKDSEIIEIGAVKNYKWWYCRKIPLLLQTNTKTI